MLKDLNTLRFLLSRRDKRKFLFLFVSMIGASILEAIGVGIIPFFVAMIMKPSALSENRWIGIWCTGLPNVPSVQLVGWASLTLVTFLFLKNIILLVVYYGQSRILNMQRVRLSDRMFRVYQSAPYDWLLQRSSAELQRNIDQDTGIIMNGVLMPCFELIMNILMGGLIIVVLLFSTPGPAFLGLLITGVGLFFVIRVFQNNLRHIGVVSRREAKEAIKAIQQGFGALIDARIGGCESYLRQMYRQSILRRAKVEIQKQVISRATPYTMEMLAISGMLVIIFLLIHGKHSLELILPLLSLLAVATLKLKQIATRMAQSFNTINVARVYIPGIVNDLTELDSLERLRNKKASGNEHIGKFNVLKIRNITYTYPDADVPAVKNVSLKLVRGESIAFVGPTGCGKSTLVNIIIGLLEPEAGCLEVNDVDIFKDIDGWRSLLGYIPQEIFLIDDTIHANIAFGVPQDEINEDALWRALKSAQLDDFIGTLPLGLDTVVGERGVRLSGGQRQRLGIARALYQNPEVLVMDEATSALDNTTEEKVMQAIQNLK
ncbi:MAG: ABC transporter ATP-binding protein, partial [Desulfobacteraceae bacterium]|nr:ABC transporter ATP-binding protein [Desulfobacteraceae bacterium]